MWPARHIRGTNWRARRHFRAPERGVAVLSNGGRNSKAASLPHMLSVRIAAATAAKLTSPKGTTRYNENGGCRAEQAWIRDNRPQVSAFGSPSQSHWWRNLKIKFNNRLVQEALLRVSKERKMKAYGHCQSLQSGRCLSLRATQWRACKPFTRGGGEN